VKELKLKKKNSFFEKLLIKINRYFGFEIINNSNYDIPSLKDPSNQNLSTIGQKSITIPMGSLKITRKVKALEIIFRSCASVLMLSQTKKRIFDKKKEEYSIRSLNSLVNSINSSKDLFESIKLKLTIIDHNSDQEILNKYNKILNGQFFESRIEKLDFEKYKSFIDHKNEKNENVTDAQKSNMSNIHQSIEISKNSDDLIYFVEDDYIHKKNSLEEMVFAYEKFSTILNDELFLCPTDYPYLYFSPEDTKVLLGNQFHWRKIDQTLCTFLTSNRMVNKHFDKLLSMCKKEHSPFEKPLHDIFKSEVCLSPIPSLAIHATNVNSIYGVSPLVNIKNLWEENKYDKNS
tara:strand:- start:220 stop:1260 length:1041 start_codon:yes stop_codon:yes gene_type:complete